MGYSDIRKRREAAKPAPKPKPQPKAEAAEVKRFEVGTVYKCGREKVVCVDRFKDTERGEIVGLVELSEHRANLKDEDFCFYHSDFGNYEEYSVRMRNGVEYALQCGDEELVDGESKPDVNGVYDLDDYEANLEDIEDVAYYSAKSPCGTEPLEQPEEDEKPKQKPRRRKRKGNPFVGIVLIIIIAALVKSCASI